MTSAGDRKKLAQIVGQAIKRARDRRGMGQEELGRALEPFLGKAWPKQAVSAAEQGRRAFVVEDLVALAAALHVPVTSLLLPADLRTSVTFPGQSISGDDLFDLVVFDVDFAEKFVDLGKEAAGLVARLGPVYEAAADLQPMLDELTPVLDRLKQALEAAAEPSPKEQEE